MLDAEWAEIDAIPGWLSRCEADCLQELAYRSMVLEIGSYQGRSTVAMARVASLVVAVDHHQGDEGTGPANTLEAFLGHLRKHNVCQRVLPLITDSWSAFKSLPFNYFDLAFIDGAHDAESVSQDIRVALHTVKRGGFIALHDRQYPGVKEAMRWHHLRVVRTVGTIAVCDRR